VDAEVKKVVEGAAQNPGYVKTTRTVCKAEWAYELEVKFDSLDNFKAYMASDWRTNVALPFLEKVKPLMKDPEAMYSGNRVSDDL